MQLHFHTLPRLPATFSSDSQQKPNKSVSQKHFVALALKMEDWEHEIGPRYFARISSPAKAFGRWRRRIKAALNARPHGIRMKARVSGRRCFQGRPSPRRRSSRDSSARQTLSSRLCECAFWRAGALLESGARIPEAVGRR